MSIKARFVIIISILVTAAFILTGIITVRETRAGMVDRVDDTLFAIQAKSGPKEPFFGKAAAASLPDLSRAHPPVRPGSRGVLQSLGFLPTAARMTAYTAAAPPA